MEYDQLIDNLRGDFPGEYVKEAASAIEELLHYVEFCDEYFDAMPYDPRDEYVSSK